jgi:hypothetical protein
LHSRAWGSHRILREREGDREGFGRQRLEGSVLLVEAPRDELSFLFGQLRPEQPSISVNVVSVRANAGQIFVEHRRHS